MSKKLVASTYDNFSVMFTEDAWFNATVVAAHFGKRVDHWLANKETKDYIDALLRHLNSSDTSDLNPRNSGDLLKARRGKNGGTWMHPSLAIAFARWLSPDFAIWADVQIKQIIEGKHPHFDWKKMRHEATASFKAMNETLRLYRQEYGKDSKAHHYMNEAKLINGVMTGEFKGRDRDALTLDELDLIAQLELRNTVLIGRGYEYQKRKVALQMVADDWKMARLDRIEEHAA